MEASWSLLKLIAKINPVQLVKIRIAVIDKIIIFFKDLKIKKNSFVLFDIIISIKIIMNDHKPLLKTTSIKGINLISLKING